LGSIGLTARSVRVRVPGTPGSARSDRVTTQSTVTTTAWPGTPAAAAARDSVYNTVYVSVLSTGMAVVLGVFFAWLVVVAYTDIHRKKLLQPFILLPFILPPYIVTLAWAQAFTSHGLGGRMRPQPAPRPGAPTPPCQGRAPTWAKAGLGASGAPLTPRLFAASAAVFALLGRSSPAVERSVISAGGRAGEAGTRALGGPVIYCAQ